MTEERKTAASEDKPSAMRWLVCFALIAGASVYSVLVLRGDIKPENRIDGSHLAIIVAVVIAVCALIKPKFLDRIEQLQIGYLKLQMKELKATQGDQQLTLSSIEQLLIPEMHQKHLLNLHGGHTANYDGKDSVRAELRHLRSVGLIEKIKDIAGIENGKKYDIAEFVKLTDDGRRWAEYFRTKSSGKEP